MIFKTKARTVDAMRLEYSTWSYMVDFGGAAIRGVQLEDGKLGAIVTIDGGAELAREGDWIVKAANGKLSIVKHETFEATYEPLAAGKLGAEAGALTTCAACGKPRDKHPYRHVFVEGSPL